MIYLQGSVMINQERCSYHSQYLLKAAIQLIFLPSLMIISFAKNKPITIFYKCHTQSDFCPFVTSSLRN